MKNVSLLLVLKIQEHFNICNDSDIDIDIQCFDAVGWSVHSCPAASNIITASSLQSSFWGLGCSNLRKIVRLNKKEVVLVFCL